MVNAWEMVLGKTDNALGEAVTSGEVEADAAGPVGVRELEDYIEPADQMLCRICEQYVSKGLFVEHTRACALVSQCQQEAFSCDTRLGELSGILVKKIAERRRLRAPPPAPSVAVSILCTRS